MKKKPTKYFICTDEQVLNGDKYCQKCDERCPYCRLVGEKKFNEFIEERKNIFTGITF